MATIIKVDGTTEEIQLNKEDSLLQMQTIVDGYIEAVGEDGFNISKTNVVRNKLNDLFEHVADKLGEEPIKEVLSLSNHLFDDNLPSNYNLPQDPDGPVIFRC
jgi:hypothetical protein